MKPRNLIFAIFVGVFALVTFAPTAKAGVAVSGYSFKEEGITELYEQSCREREGTDINIEHLNIEEVQIIYCHNSKGSFAFICEYPTTEQRCERLYQQHICNGLETQFADFLSGNEFKYVVMGYGYNEFTSGLAASIFNLEQNISIYKNRCQLETDILSRAQGLQASLKRLSDAVTAQAQTCKKEDPNVAAAAVDVRKVDASGLPSDMVVECGNFHREVTLERKLDYQGAFDPIVVELRTSWVTAKSAAEQSTPDLDARIASLDKAMNTARDEYWAQMKNDNEETNFAEFEQNYLKWEENNLEASRDEKDAEINRMRAEIVKPVGVLHIARLTYGPGEKEHLEKAQAALDKIWGEYEAFRGGLLQDKATEESAAVQASCQEEIARLHGALNSSLESAKIAARDDKDPCVSNRIDRVKADMLAALGNYDSAMEGLHTAPGTCAGMGAYNPSVDTERTRIDREYNNLIRELESSMSTAQKAFEAEKTKIQNVLKSDFDSNKKLAKDKKADLEPQRRSNTLQANMTAAIQKYRTDMAALYSNGGGCEQTYNPSNDQFLIGIQRQVDALTRELGNEKSPEYQNPATLKALQENANNMRANEQSLANRLLGGTSIMLSGIGGAQLAQGYAERQSDQEGAAEMAAYRDTYRCSIGDNGPFSIRDEGEPHMVPGYSATTVALKNEYITLAEDLRAKKDALGMLPGIESEPILDTGRLYQGGAAGEGIAQRFDTAEERLASGAANTRMAVGGAMLGAGVIGGAIGNAVINRNAPTNQAREIQTAAMGNRPTANLQGIAEQIIPALKDNCPTNATGNHPDCDCGSNAEYHRDENLCIPCSADQTVQDGKCVDNVVASVMPQRPVVQSSSFSHKCFNPTETDEEKMSQFEGFCTQKGGRVVIIEIARKKEDGIYYFERECRYVGAQSSDCGSWSWIESATGQPGCAIFIQARNIKGKVIEGTEGGSDPWSSECKDELKVEVSVADIPSEISLVELGDVNFDFARSILTEEGRNRVKAFAEQVEEWAQTLPADKKWKIKITGYADAVGGDGSGNMQLSIDRANTVKNALVREGLDAHNLETEGKGAACAQVSADASDGERAKDRKVVLCTYFIGEEGECEICTVTTQANLNSINGSGVITAIIAATDVVQADDKNICPSGTATGTPCQQQRGATGYKTAVCGAGGLCVATECLDEFELVAGQGWCRRKSS